ncbi:hypothetical protein ACIBI9_14750 [Nonomuraea sp. NPDC050451]|uniref:hypothetical protein n=1 Tax=Nonomuraea sp. NPDC050451 TaxID=3364364 RepID=UPI0037A4408C
MSRSDDEGTVPATPVVASGMPGLEWFPYDSPGTRTRVREYLTRGNVEYEQCIEGGAYLIRRTQRSNVTKPTVMEIGRGRTRIVVLDLWKLIVMGDIG